MSKSTLNRLESNFSVEDRPEGTIHSLFAMDAAAHFYQAWSLNESIVIGSTIAHRNPICMHIRAGYLSAYAALEAQLNMFRAEKLNVLSPDSPRQIFARRFLSKPRVSIEDKLTDWLEIVGIPSIKEYPALWGAFKEVQKVRNEFLVHFDESIVRRRASKIWKSQKLPLEHVWQEYTRHISISGLCRALLTIDLILETILATNTQLVDFEFLHFISFYSGFDLLCINEDGTLTEDAPNVHVLMELYRREQHRLRLEWKLPERSPGR